MALSFTNFVTGDSVSSSEIKSQLHLFRPNNVKRMVDSGVNLQA